MIKIVPSILAADFANLERDITAVQAAGADYIHFDVMDGIFVPNITFGLPVLESIKKITSIPIDVHLMIKEPDRYIERFIAAGAGIITVHVESEGDTLAQIRKIRGLGAKAAAAVSPGTPVSEILDLLPELDMALVMTVEPGFGGQGLMESTIFKIRLLRQIINENSYKCDLQVDGGVTMDNVADVAGYGANVIVAGSAIFHAPDPGLAVAEMRRMTEVY